MEAGSSVTYGNELAMTAERVDTVTEPTDELLFYQRHNCYGNKPNHGWHALSQPWLGLFP